MILFKIDDTFEGVQVFWSNQIILLAHWLIFLYNVRKTIIYIYILVQILFSLEYFFYTS